MKPDNQPTVIITGASSGIGLKLAQRYLDAGYRVVAGSRNIAAANTLKAGPNVALVEGDVADPEVAARLVQTAIDRFGRLDVLINNAGIFVPKAFEDYTLADYQRVVATNLTGFFLATQNAVRAMKQQGSGHILNISTTLVDQPVVGVNAALTSITKGGLNAVTRGLAMELAASNIRVNAIAPGIIDTPMHTPESHGFLKGLHPIPRLGTVDEIADAALYLTQAGFVTGEVIHVDGGAHAGKW